MDPHGVLFIFLPVLIFEGGFNGDMHIMKKQARNILTLAYPSVFFCCFFLSISIKVQFIFLHKRWY